MGTHWGGEGGDNNHNNYRGTHWGGEGGITTTIITWELTGEGKGGIITTITTRELKGLNRSLWAKVIYSEYFQLKERTFRFRPPFLRPKS